MKGGIVNMSTYPPEEVAQFTLAYVELVEGLKGCVGRCLIRPGDSLEVRRELFNHATSEIMRRYELVVPSEVEHHLRPSLECLVQALIAPETRPDFDD